MMSPEERAERVAAVVASTAPDLDSIGPLADLVSAGIDVAELVLILEAGPDDVAFALLLDRIHEKTADELRMLLGSAVLLLYADRIGKD